MDLNYNASEEAFRGEVKEFLSMNVPADLSDKIANSRKLTRDDLMRWQGILHKKGWGGPAWPKQFGGTGWSTSSTTSAPISIRPIRSGSASRWWPL
jgi:alkylation response protein AidB-like acyl-CoA dehydrogenase